MRKEFLVYGSPAIESAEIEEVVSVGIPVVSTTHCDIPEVVQYGKDGWLAAVANVGELVAKLRWLVQHPEQWGPMLDAGRAHVEAEFDASRQGRGLARFYNGVVGKSLGV